VLWGTGHFRMRGVCDKIAHRASFDQFIGGTYSGAGGTLDQFWEQFAEDDEIVAHHPYVNRLAPHMTLPIGIHSDGVPLTKSSKEGLWALSWNSLVGLGPSLDTRMLITAIPTSFMLSRRMHGRLSTDPMWDALRWSFDALGSGKFPERDHTGLLFSDTAPGSFRAMNAGAQHVK
jgi:hypothetical protein